MAEQVTEMMIKVDLQCCRCYKKIRKILCEIPQVKDLIFDEKQNKVKIKVVGCDPEKVRQKICCKGRNFILGIDIIPPEPPKEKEPKKEEPKKEEKKKEEKKDDKPQTPEPSKKPPPVIGYPPVYMMGKVYVCISCHHGGCGWFCPCNCHCGGPPICADGCGRPAHECRCKRPLVCADGCGKPPHECICKRPQMCPDGCGRPPHECICKKPSMCHDGCGRRAHECSCQRPRKCADGCGRPPHECICKRPPVCQDGCGRPAHECSCQRPIYPRCCDRCSYGNASSSWTLHGCDYGRPPVCTNAGYDCDTSCPLM